MTDNKRYPSDITREQFEVIRPSLESVKKKTRPRMLDLYDVFCGVLYILKEGCRWASVPKEYPDYRRLHYYFSIWRDSGILDEVLKKLVWDVRTSNGRKGETSFLIIDAQSVKNTESAKEKGYDAGKKISGIKRHIAVDTQGLPHSIHITKADFTDRNGAIEMIKNSKKSLSKVKNILADGGYSGKNFADEIKTIICAKVEVVKRNELHKFVVLPKRWVVERSFSWLEKCRRLWKNCEKLLESSLAMAQLSFIRLLLCRKIWDGY